MSRYRHNPAEREGNPASASGIIVPSRFYVVPLRSPVPAYALRMRTCGNMHQRRPLRCPGERKPLMDRKIIALKLRLSTEYRTFPASKIF